MAAKPQGTLHLVIPGPRPGPCTLNFSRLLDAFEAEESVDKIVPAIRVGS